MDKYDEQIAELTENPRRIPAAWSRGEGLFQFATCGGKAEGETYGCLTMIRNNVRYTAATPELTEEIRADKRIPINFTEIKPEHLPIFAEWQRRLDREIRNNPDHL